MMSVSRRSRAKVAILLAAVLGTAACSSSNSPTGYGGGGGGGGGGTAKLLNLGPFGVGQSIKFTFANPGSNNYHCIPHQAMGMTGTVTVDASGVDSAMVQVGAGGGFQFAPLTAHIKPGGYVRWVNISGSGIHTVTSD